MKLTDTKVSRHENPDLVKIEFVGDEDVVLVSMRVKGINDLLDEQAVARALRVMSGVLENDPAARADSIQTAGTDQTLSQP